MIVEEAPVTTELPVRRFTREEFHRIIKAGVLDSDERVELIDGTIMLMLPIGDPHIACVRRINTLFHRRLLSMDPTPAFVDVQSSVRLSENDNPIPDVMLVHPRVHAEARAPRAGEVFLLVEVAASSLAYDRGLKLRRYALHGIAEVWVVALERECVYVYRRPAGEEYQSLQTYSRGDGLGIEALPEVGLISVDDVLGQPARGEEAGGE